MPTQIRHLVVLMLENRSFDHMLGFLKRDNPAIDGLNGNEWNYPAQELDPNVVVSDNAADVHDLTPDPHHDFGDVTQQIFSNTDPTTPADMRGFVRNYFVASGDPVRAGNVMKCFTQATLPVLSTLAKQYAVCDRWFASVPGSTIPNRMFVHGANSVGSVNQDAIDAPFLLKTIFESFDATTPYDYRIYSTGASILLANKYLIQHQGKFFPYANFTDDARNGNLPAYTFIEPTYDDDGQGNFATSQHPDFPVARGEGLIRDIYNALTQSPGWKSTLLLILYSQHGGIFDHVVPPTVTRLPSSAGLPDVTQSLDPPFDFTRLGVRVPAVFVSPCIAPGTLLHDRDYEHSSVVATVRKLFCPGSQPLNWREAQAPTFDDVLALTGSAIRTDVVQLPVPVVSLGVTIEAAAEVRRPTDLSVLFARAMDCQLQQRGIAPPGDVNALTNAADVAIFLQEAQKLSAQLGITIGPSTHVARDSWTTDDSLGHFTYAYAIYRFLTNRETKSPLAVSIQAPWGGGKTSLMRMIQVQLDPDALEQIDQTKAGATTDNGNASVKRILNELGAAARSSESDLPFFDKSTPSKPTLPSIPPSRTPDRGA
jgi:phospholipase C